MTDTLSLRVYYEDTDLAGIVYYANYLKFIERGRTEYVRARGIDQAALMREAGLVFAVRRVEADYLAPARFGDDLEVETGVEAVKGASLVMLQRVCRAGEVLFSARVVLVAIGPGGGAVRLPADIRRRLG
ncbi:MAG: tol-pal system-associated acyl-CoA thioesterase [Rhodobacterales bacterium]|nr:MAG: tol-pal system-associated acyl-CoA thioesterase [Rhodobacterales bacterium]